jgi:hypothetical protein
MDGLEDVATSAKQLREVFAAQLVVIQKMNPREAVADKLKSVVNEREEALLRQDIDKAWGASADGAKEDLQKHVGWFNGYSSFLSINASTPAGGWDKSPLKDIVTLYQTGDFEGAEAKRKEPAPAVKATAGRAKPTKIKRAKVTSSRSVGGSLQRWLQVRRGTRRMLREGTARESESHGIRDYLDAHAEIIHLVVIPILVAVAGVVLVWAKDSSFTGDLLDWGKLFFYGLVAQISGITAAQAVGVGPPAAAATT